MKYAIAKVSTKGQIVIPAGLRDNIHTGDEFLMVRDHDRIVLKNMVNLSKEFKDDFVFAEKVENAWHEHDNGKFENKTKDDFLRELRLC